MSITILVPALRDSNTGARIAEELLKIRGVKNVQIQLPGKVLVSYDRTLVSPSQLTRTIRLMGFRTGKG